MLKKIAKVLSMGSLAGLMIAKIRGVRINPPALRILLAILVVMAFLVDTPIVVLFAGTWLIFLLTTDVARLMGINLSLFITASDNKKKNEEQQRISSDQDNSRVENKPNVSKTPEFIRSGVSMVSGVFGKLFSAVKNLRDTN